MYDDAESSYKHAIEKNFDGKFEVHCFGINDVVFPKSNRYFYHKIDLSLCNFALIDELKKIAKLYGAPKIILASPPCESWSGADCGGCMFKEIDDNGKWVVNNKKYYENYNKVCHPVKHRDFIKKERSRILGEATIGGTIEIIDFFKPKYWVIENPTTSKSWKYQTNHWDFNGFINKTYYSSYDKEFSTKPTIFKSNIKLELKAKKISGNKSHMAKGNYAKRSSIPFDLIVDIIGQILKEEYVK